MWRAHVRLAPLLVLFTLLLFCFQRIQLYWEWEVLEGIFWCKDAFLCNICLTTTTINSKWLLHITINNKDCLFKIFNSQRTKYTKRLRAKTTKWTRVTVNRPPKTTNNLRRRGYHKVPKSNCRFPCQSRLNGWWIWYSSFAKYHVTALLYQEIQRLQPCWRARNSTKDFKNKVSSISDSNLYVHHNFVYNLICKTNRSFLPPASSYGEKDHFTKTIFVSTSTTKVILLQLWTYFLMEVKKIQPPIVWFPGDPDCGEGDLGGEEGGVGNCL